MTTIEPLKSLNSVRPERSAAKSKGDSNASTSLAMPATLSTNGFQVSSSFSSTRIFLFFATLLLTACGFHLHGQVGMPFQSIYLTAPNLNSPFVNELRRNLVANKVALANGAEPSDVVLNIVSENTEKQVLSLGSDGRVNEYRLIYRVSLRAYNQQQQEWIPSEDMSLRRDFSYDDTQILAKEAEETLLYQSMRTDMVQQIVRRLSRAKPTPIVTP